MYLLPRRRAGVLLIVATSLVGAMSLPRAHAETSAADLSSARDLMRDGKELRAKGDHAGALKKFQAAYLLFPTPITGLAVAQEQVATGKLVEARETLNAIDRMPTKSTESDEGRKAREEVATLRAQVVARIPTLEITLDGLAAGKTVALTIDGAPVAALVAEQGVSVNPGAHVVVAKSDAEERTRSVDVPEGRRTKVELDFKVAVTPKPAETAKPAETTKPAETPKPVEASAGGNSTRWIGVAAVSVGVVGLGVGGILGLSARSTANGVDCPNNHCASQADADQRNAAVSRGNLATLFVGVGAALAVGGVVIWLVAPSESKGAGVTTVGVSPTGVVLGGRF